MPALWRGMTVAIGALAGCSAMAQSVTPAQLRDALAQAKGGQTIKLAAGDFGQVAFPRATYDPPIIVDATAARFSGLTLRGVNGVRIKGGTLQAPREQVFGVTVDSARNVQITGMRIGGSRVGVAVSRSQDIAVLDNRLDGVRSDGINVTQSQRVRIERNACLNFSPISAQYSPEGKLVKDGDHPDCIQGWSLPGTTPTGDITIVGNTARGFMQGVWFGNPNSGGFDRVVVRDNDFELSAWNGIVLKEVRGAEVTGNIVRTLPGAKMDNFPFKPVKSWLKIDGSDIKACGNQVSAWPRGEGTGRCR